MNPSFREWIRQEADLIDSDGCSFATGARKICCLIHDLEYFYAKDAGDAYVLCCEGIKNYWAQARPTNRQKVDSDFVRCNQREAWLGWFSPIAAIRRLVKVFGQRAWDKHRARDV